MCSWFIVRARISRPPACEGHFISARRFDQRRHLGALALPNHIVADYFRARRLHLLHQGSGRANMVKAGRLTLHTAGVRLPVR